MKITMYELLGMIKDGKAPKKIKYNGKLYEFNDKKDNYYENEICSINWDYVSLHCLNKEVEILDDEEKELPEKLNIELNSGDENKVNYYRATNLECDLAFKINSIIDYLKSKGE